jgi:hypothetical protein
MIFLALKTIYLSLKHSFCDALIREQDKLVQLGVISTVGTSNKALVVHQKDKPKNPKKQHPRHNNKQYKGPKPTQTAFAPNGDKGAKYKSKKTDRHCNFCDKDGHDESKCFKKMEALEATMKKHNISIDSTFSWTCTFCFWFLLQYNFYFFF